MIYIRNLYYWRKGGVKDDKIDNVDNRNNKDNNRDNKNQRYNRDNNKEKIQDNNRKYKNNQESQGNVDKSDDWNRDREQFQQSQSKGILKVRGRIRDNRNDRYINPQRRNYEQKNKDSEFQKRDESQIKRSQVRTRGGIQKSSN